MESSLGPDDETRALRRCVRDLVALSVLSATWDRAGPRSIAEDLTDVVSNTLDVDLVYVRLTGVGDEDTVEAARTALGPESAPRVRELGRGMEALITPGGPLPAPTIDDPVGPGRTRVAVTAIGVGAESGSLVATSRRPDFPTQSDRLILGVCANQAAMVLQRQRAEAEVRQLNALLREQATTDSLTGLGNRRRFQEEYESAESLSLRTGRPLSLVLLDLDLFKTYNDTHGHPAGDDVLRSVGDLIRRMIRPSDLAVRYGGEEFVLLLPEADAVTAGGVAERMRVAIAGHPWALHPMTASFGVATIPSSRHARSELVEEADRALYHSKKAGRDRVTHHEDLDAIATRRPDRLTSPSRGIEPSVTTPGRSRRRKS